MNAHYGTGPAHELGDKLYGVDWNGGKNDEKHLILREMLRQVCVVVDLSDACDGRRLVTHLSQLYEIVSTYLIEFLAQNMCSTVALLIARNGCCEVACSFTTSQHTLLRALRVAFAQRTESAVTGKSTAGSNTFSMLNVVKTASSLLNILEKRLSNRGKETKPTYYRHFAQEIIVFLSNPLSINPASKLQDRVFRVIKENTSHPKDGLETRDKQLENSMKQLSEAQGLGVYDSLSSEGGLTRLTLVGLHDAPCVHLQLMASSPEYQLIVCQRLFDCNYIRVGTEPPLSIIKALALPKTITRRESKKPNNESHLFENKDGDTDEKVESKILFSENNEEKKKKSDVKETTVCALPVCFPKVFTPTTTGLCMCHLSPYGYGNDSKHDSSLSLCSIHGMMRECPLCLSVLCRDGMFCPTCGVMLLDGVGLTAAREHMRPPVSFERVYDLEQEEECYGCFLKIKNEFYKCTKCGTKLCSNCYNLSTNLNMCPVCDLH